MATEVIRCSECSTPFKGVPLWLANAKVTFTCTSCPKKGSRGLARFEPSPEEASPIADLDRDSDLDTVEIEDDDDNDQVMELPDDDTDSSDDKEDL